MAETEGAADRHAQVSALVRAAAAGQYKPVYLFAGEPFDTAAAAHALIDVLVPAARRSFNLESYDGRTTAVARILDSARMHGFFAGVKVVWMRETTIFLSGEKRGDLTKSLLAAWRDGREQEAAEKLLTLVALAGWSQEQFAETHWSGVSKSRLKEVFGDELAPQELALLDAVHVACSARDMSVSAYRDDSAALQEFLDRGVPAEVVLLFTASTVDARKRLYKRLREVGAVVDLSVGRERSGALSRETVDDLLRFVAHARGKRIAADAQQLILRRAGTDSALLASELEKLCLSVGDRATITEEDVRCGFHDMAESWIFDFTSALATRQLGRALPLLRGLFEQGEPPLRLLAMIVRELRLLLVARECLDDSLRGTWRGDLPFNVFQGRVIPHIDADTMAAFGKVHPFVLYRRLQDAGRLTARMLRRALVRLSDLDLRFKSSRSDPGLLLEAFVIEWCATAKRAAPSDRILGR